MPTESPRSTLMFSAQARSYGLKHPESQGSSSSQPQTPKMINGQRVYSLLPKHNTPVSRKVVKNPFNERLLEVFNKPTCSPDFCSSFGSTVVSESNNAKEFFWTVEDLWRIDPAPIDSPQTDVDDCLDDETESLAQEAIERYFQESHNVLSPIGSPNTRCTVQGATPELTPQCHADNRANSTPCTRRDRKLLVKFNASTQTTLSFSADIPDSIMDLLKPFTNTLDESRMDLSSSNTNTSSLRRKLLFNELCDSLSNSDTDDDCSKKFTSRYLPGDWTPDRVKATAELFSQSPDISPIAEGVLAEPDYSERHDEQLVADKNMGNLHHMSVDDSFNLTMDVSNIQQCSSDNGYHTYTADKSADDRTSTKISSVKISSVRDSSTTRNVQVPMSSTANSDAIDSKFTRSFVGCTTNSSDTGVTSTPAIRKSHHPKH